MNDQSDNRQRRRERIQNVREAMNTNMGLEMGKLPPQCVDLEEAVIGAAMLETEACAKVLEILHPDVFYKSSHSLIMKAITVLRAESSPIDILTVTQQLRKSEELDIVGGPSYIAQLTNRVASTANIEFHARIVQQKFMQRELIRISNETIRDSYDESTDVFDLIENLSRNLSGITEQNVTGQSLVLHVADIIPETNMDMERRLNSENGGSEFITGIKQVDKIVGGWQPGDLIYIAARPGMGKTSFIISNALFLALLGIPVAIFSLEMQKRKIVFRLISLMTGIDVKILVSGKLDPEQQTEYYKALDRLKKLPIFIDDRAGLSVYEFGTKMRRLRNKHGVRIAFLDYVQLMTIGKAASKKSQQNGNREQELATISKNLKEVAKELDIPVVALAQLSRAVETRGGKTGGSDKRPMLSDLRESGALEQDADLVAFLYRPEYYGITTNAEGESTEGLGEFIIAKHRNGALDTAYMRFVHYLAKYTNLHEEWRPVARQVEHSDKRAEGLPRNEQFLEKENPGPGKDSWEQTF